MADSPYNIAISQATKVVRVAFRLCSLA